MVPDARPLPEVSYEEAMELSFFGAKVLHPRTMQPVYRRGIPTWIKNTLEPEALGTCIHREATPDGVRGLTLLTDVAMITVSGPVMQGTKGTAARVFDGVARAGVSVILITQGSSEFSISFCVREADAAAACSAACAAFADAFAAAASAAAAAEAAAAASASARAAAASNACALMSAGL